MERMKTGLPNTCSNCGKLQKKYWYAKNQDMARSGQGLCLNCKKDLEAPSEPEPTADSSPPDTSDKGKGSDQISISKEDTP